jgi:hypothetical protein
MINQIRPTGMAARPLELITRQHKCYNMVASATWNIIHDSLNFRTYPIDNVIRIVNVVPMCEAHDCEQNHSWVLLDDS